MKSLTTIDPKKQPNESDKSQPQPQGTTERRKPPETAQCCAKTARVVAGCHD